MGCEGRERRESLISIKDNIGTRAEIECRNEYAVGRKKEGYLDERTLTMERRRRRIGKVGIRKRESPPNQVEWVKWTFLRDVKLPRQTKINSAVYEHIPCHFEMFLYEYNVRVQIWGSVSIKVFFVKWDIILIYVKVISVDNY